MNTRRGGCFHKPPSMPRCLGCTLLISTALLFIVMCLFLFHQKWIMGCSCSCWFQWKPLCSVSHLTDAGLIHTNNNRHLLQQFSKSWKKLFFISREIYLNINFVAVSKWITRWSRAPVYFTGKSSEFNSQIPASLKRFWIQTWLRWRLWFYYFHGSQWLWIPLLLTLNR